MVDESVNDVLMGRSQAHREAIMKEMQRRQDVKNEAIRLAQEAQKAKERR